MNCRLSCGADRKIGKIGFTYEKSGRIVKSGVFKTVSGNAKENMLESIIRGMRACRNEIQHDDLLVIEVQNQHLAQWLSGEIVYKGYEDYLDRLFDTLERMDCRYKFSYVAKPYALEYIKTHEISREKLSSMNSLMEEFV